MADELTNKSKFLSFVLRHKPDEIGVELDTQGWGSVAQIANKSGGKLSVQEILDIVATSDKKRFSLSPDQAQVRANQGHSFPVDLGLQRQTPPDTLYHGTATRFVDAIVTEGLRKQSRQHVHLTDNVETATQVGQRYGKAVIFHVDAKSMHTAGHAFYRSENDVWLTEYVEPKFLRQP
ncbi:RNA 2'-phosphotransferase [Loktanella sp. S4079]|uniref:RNA 2'-phosphotransferase n=1 Tax=Loktanella sp. S4079 TaxID=579483 RepID=UPI0005FA32FB|nr:RNA 2'-phosphotransferase [Loktanella sp. S4079]KJZ19609.1 RNA 2'-phosphotransferase [Loktanella sp. S4079]